MNFAKVNLLLVTLMSFTVGTVGCVNAQSYSTASLDSSRVLLGPATKNQTATSPAVQPALVSFHQTVQPTAHASAAPPLTTLGPGDDLLNMVENASGVVLLDFYADWCGPCRTQGGILHEMERTAAQTNSSMIKVNIDQHRSLASAFNVTSLPTLILIKDGRIIERQTGVANHQRVAALLSR